MLILQSFCDHEENRWLFVTKVLDADLTAKDKKRGFDDRMQIPTGVLARIRSGFQS
jgi:hypothetical protein